MNIVDDTSKNCDLLEELVPVKENKKFNIMNKKLKSYKELITFVTDRPGHDVRYAVDTTKIYKKLGWNPVETFETGIKKTVKWYLRNETWWTRVQDGSYQGERLGLVKKDD